MSWRFIFAILVVAAGASAWSGLRLGDWLVAHGPQTVPVTEETHPELKTTPVLDANGVPYVAQPPQPLVDGTLAVPQAPAEVAWKLPDESTEQTAANAPIDVATTPITMQDAINIASSNQYGLQGIADVGETDLNTSALTAGSFDKAQQRQQQQQPLQPIEMGTPPPPPSTTPAPATDNAWHASLRQELQACSSQGFFERPSCAWAARNKYCGPNNGWGRISDCPAKKF